MDKVLQAIADPTRRSILDLLMAEQLSAGEIAQHFPDISRPAVSQHLAVLREAGLLTVQKEGRRQIYRLNPTPLRAVWEDWLRRYEVLWSERLGALKRVAEAAAKSNQAGKPNGTRPAGKAERMNQVESTRGHLDEH